MSFVIFNVANGKHYELEIDFGCCKVKKAIFQHPADAKVAVVSLVV